MRYVEIRQLDPKTGGILHAVNDEGDTVDIYNYPLFMGEITELIPYMTESAMCGGEKVLQVKTVISAPGIGIPFDIAGEAGLPEKFTLMPSEFWYINMETAVKSGLY